MESIEAYQALLDAGTEYDLFSEFFNDGINFHDIEPLCTVNWFAGTFTTEIW